MGSPFQFGNCQTGDGRLVPFDPAVLALRFDASALPILYLGEAFIGASPAEAVWRITRYDVTAPAVVQTWADGNAGFAHVWNDRATLSYQ